MSRQVDTTIGDKDKSIYADADYIRGAMLGLEFTGDEAEEKQLEALAESASRMIDDFTTNVFYQKQIRGEKKKSQTDFENNIILRTEYKPIVSVQSLEFETIPRERVAIDLDSLDIHYKQGYIVIYPYGYNTVDGGSIRNAAYRYRYYNTVISYTAGPEETPSPIKRACALLVRNMLIPGEVSSGIAKKTSTNKGDLKKVSSKSYTEEYDTSAGSSGGMRMSVKPEEDFLFTSDVRAILLPYMKRGTL